MVEMYVLGLVLEEETKAPILTLLSKDSQMSLQIVIAPLEGMAVSMALQQLGSRKPYTHELALKILDVLGGKLLAIEIYQGTPGIFNADLLLESPLGDTTRIDSRPADAIILAMGARSPILVNKELLADQGIEDNLNTEMNMRLKKFEDFTKNASKVSQKQNGSQNILVENQNPNSHPNQNLNPNQDKKTKTLPSITISLMQKNKNGEDKIVDTATIGTPNPSAIKNTNSGEPVAFGSSQERQKWLEQVQAQARISKIITNADAASNDSPENHEEQQRWKKILNKLEPLSKYKM